MNASRFPHSLALIFGMIVVAQLLTYVLPPGAYDLARDKETVPVGTSLQLPPGRKVLVPDELSILLPDGRRVLLPGGLQLKRGWGGPLTLPAGRTMTLADGREVAMPGGTGLVAPDGTTYHLPASASLPLPSGSDVELPGGRRGYAFDGTEIRLPDGSYTLVPSRKVLEGSYHPVEAEPLPWYAVLTAIPRGMGAAADVIFFVFLVGGVIAVIGATGAINAAIGTAIRLFHGSSLVLVATMMTLFAVGSSTIGMAEEYMAFIPILVAMSLALGMDAVVAIGIVYIGAGVGYGFAALNPFTVLIAKRIAGLPEDTGFWERWVLLGLGIAIGTHHVLRYAKRVKTDPSRSLVADVEYGDDYKMPDDVALTPRRLLVLALFAGGIGLFVWGSSRFQWYFTELGAIFLGVALLSAVVGRLSPNQVCERFCAGAADLTTTALLVGFARTIQVVLEDGKVIHTVIHGTAGALNYLGPQVAAVGMLGVQTVCNFLVPSGSGQAYVTMPIMAPLADITKVGRETAVLAYQFGDGFTNMIVPTNALLMGMLALGKVPYQRWARFVVPLLLKIYVVLVVVLVISVRYFK